MSALSYGNRTRRFRAFRDPSTRLSRARVRFIKFRSRGNLLALLPPFPPLPPGKQRRTLLSYGPLNVHRPVIAEKISRNKTRIRLVSTIFLRSERGLDLSILQFPRIGDIPRQRQRQRQREREGTRRDESPSPRLQQPFIRTIHEREGEQHFNKKASDLIRLTSLSLACSSCSRLLFGVLLGLLASCTCC